VKHERIPSHDNANEMIGVICSDALKKVELLRCDFRSLVSLGDSFKEVVEVAIRDNLRI
jgi:hypothetical protein